MLALFAALSGSAIAAGLVTTNQIKNGTIRLIDLHPKTKSALKGQRGLRGPAGASGVAGAQGPAGPAGPVGPRGAQGAQGPVGPQGPKGDTGATGAAGPKGDKGDQGDKGDTGDAGPLVPGNFGPLSYTGQEDKGCFDTDGEHASEGQDVWAHDSADRYFVVTAAQDGSGYFVTRYDANGEFTTIPGAQYARSGPCEAAVYTEAQTGSFNGVWTKKVTGDFDYNPDAAPESHSWDDFLSAVFDGGNVTDVSYEFDYYNSCGDHWRDAYYDGSFTGGGFIGECS
jgi:hypothetical protein